MANNLESRVSKASLILAGISQAICYADADIGNVSASGNWLSLIDAALSEANRLLTGHPLGWEDGAVESIITPDLLNIAQKDVKGNFDEYLKSHDQEEQIKQAGLHYFFALYLMIIFGRPKNMDEPAGVKEKLKEFIVEKNNIKELFHTLDNFDFYIGACGIEAQNLALKTI